MSNIVSQPIAELRNVEVTDGDQPILRGVSLGVERGERLAITGPNGSGKSTILGVMDGIITASAGETYVFGNNMAELDQKQRDELVRTRVGVGFQTSNLDEGRTVYDNLVSLRDTTRSLSRTERRQQNGRLASLVVSLGLHDKLDQIAHTLSGGEKQRVAIGRLLLPDPELILLDEPTASLDSAGTYGKTHIYEVIGDFAARSDATVVVVSHDAEALRFTTRELQVRDGSIVYDAPSIDLAGYGANP